ncbi:type 4 pilin [Microcystis flos-aquae FACHB-1344]|uniref:Type 4 pilin n=1 Tax=Microcystis flos-aquae FACHB-1344 TaxID=2692899 RepID=A0ABR8HX14_9CHRO|nr:MULTISPECIES: type 4 pilin [Microcystis]MBD2624070.1 type 4 pilin [Microcystis flos-aquae FACHB-1344]MCA2699989.1 type 4 pilin [Microcystis sp. M179S2]
MLEVIIAILTITAFLTGTLQLMAVNALYKVRAERQAKANFWIQEDFEDVKALASSLDVNSSPANPNVSDDVCTNIAQGYATALRRQLTNTPLPTTTIPTEQLVATREIVGKKYSLHRTFNITNQSANPHRLRIDYQVQLAKGQTANDYRNQENVIARSSVEVIPDASFECP